MRMLFVFLSSMLVFQQELLAKPSSLIQVFRGKGVMASAEPLLGGRSIEKFESTVVALTLPDGKRLIGMKAEYPYGRTEQTGLVLGVNDGFVPSLDYPKEKVKRGREATLVFLNSVHTPYVPLLYPQKGIWSLNRGHGPDSAWFRGDDRNSKFLKFEIEFKDDMVTISGQGEVVHGPSYTGKATDYTSSVAKSWKATSDLEISVSAHEHSEPLPYGIKSDYDKAKELLFEAFGEDYHIGKELQELFKEIPQGSAD